MLLILTPQYEPFTHAGRAGRVSKGRVYRLVSRSFYEKILPDYSLPEMQVGYCVQMIALLKLY